MEAALVHYAQGLAHRLAPKGIRAKAVSPGNTCFPGGVWARIERDNPPLRASALALNPAGRTGTPEELARAIVFLASPAASFITGTNLVVDGALTRGVQLRACPGGSGAKGLALRRSARSARDARGQDGGRVPPAG